MYVADGISIESNAPLRLTNTTSCWGFFTRGILGAHALNEDNLLIDGAWKSEQILLGFSIDLKKLTISLPEQKIEGAEVFFNELIDKRGSHFLTLLEVQQLRWHLEHFQATNEMWKTIKAPTDILLGALRRK